MGTAAARRRPDRPARRLLAPTDRSRVPPLRLNAMTPRRLFSLVLGLVMIAFGSYVALHPLWAPGRPVTSSRWLDVAFALFFLLRGALYLRALRRPAPAPGATPGTTP